MKAILVMDMPKDCDECPLSDCGECDALGGKYDGRCPLKPMPEHKTIQEFEELDFLKASYELGRASVNYEILGEEE